MNVISSLPQPQGIEVSVSEEYVVDARDEVRPLEQVQERLCHLLRETPVSLSSLRPETIGRPRFTLR